MNNDLRWYIFFTCFTVLLAGCDKEEPDPGPLSFSIETKSFPEGNVNKEIDLEVKVVGFPGDKTITYEIKPNTAQPDVDIVASTGTLMVESGAAVLPVIIVGDQHLELTETFFVELSDGTATATFTLSILDDDNPSEIRRDEKGYYTPDQYPSMHLVWSDEFDGSTLDDSNWTYELGDGCDKNLCGWGNNELQVYTNLDQNIRVAEGMLTIEAVKQDNQNFSSARIISQDKVEEQLGRIDIRARLPKGQGIWPAIWMLGANIDEVSWPSSGEIDIMELVGHEPHIVHGTVHYDNGAGYKTSSGGYALQFEDFSDQFHVFTLVWDLNKLEWYVDNQLYKTFTQTPGEQYPFNNAFFFIFNVAVGGNWPGKPDATTVFPQQMVVDYIRVFR